MSELVASVLKDKISSDQSCFRKNALDCRGRRRKSVKHAKFLNLYMEIISLNNIQSGLNDWVGSPDERTA